METQAYIYELIDPTTNATRYIGQTLYPEKRLRSHFDQSNRVRSYKNIWLKSLRRNGISPYLNVIDIVPFDAVDYWEKWYIELYKSWGSNLTNGTIGGEKGNIPLPHVKEKISSSLKEWYKSNPQSEETKKKRLASIGDGIGRWNKGRVATEKTRQALSNAQKGRVHTEQTKSKMSKSQIGDKNHQYGKHKTEEEKQKLSESLKKAYSNPLLREKLSNLAKQKANYPNYIINVKNGLKNKYESIDETTKKTYRGIRNMEISFFQKSLWKDPEYKAKMLNRKRPKSFLGHKHSKENIIKTTELQRLGKVKKKLSSILESIKINKQWL